MRRTGSIPRRAGVALVALAVLLIVNADASAQSRGRTRVRTRQAANAAAARANAGAAPVWYGPGYGTATPPVWGSSGYGFGYNQGWSYPGYPMDYNPGWGWGVNAGPGWVGPGVVTPPIAPTFRPSPYYGMYPGDNFGVGLSQGVLGNTHFTGPGAIPAALPSTTSIGGVSSGPAPGLPSFPSALPGQPR